MFVGTRSNDPAFWCSLEKSALNQVRLVVIFQSIYTFANGNCQSLCTNRASTTMKMTMDTPVMFRIKSMKDRPTALPIMILGGSPIRVAVPPILEDNIWAKR